MKRGFRSESPSTGVAGAVGVALAPEVAPRLGTELLKIQSHGNGMVGLVEPLDWFFVLGGRLDMRRNRPGSRL